MTRLFGILYSMGSITLAGSAVVVALVTGYVTWQAILGAAVAGAVLALPVCWLLAKRLTQQRA